MKIRALLTMVAMILVAGCSGTASDQPQSSSSSAASTPAPVTPEDARAIAKEAYIYGFPMVDNYRVQYT